MVGGPETKAVKSELKWLTGRFASARELDVLIEERVRPLRNGPVDAEARALERDLALDRDRSLAGAKATIEGERYRSIGLKAALWLAAGEWIAQQAAGRDRPGADFAAAVFARRCKKILKRIRKIDQLDARGRHKLRIAVKKLAMQPSSSRGSSAAKRLIGSDGGSVASSKSSRAPLARSTTSRFTGG
jgi:CHAD domain-containing protein